MTANKTTKPEADCPQRSQDSGHCVESGIQEKKSVAAQESLFVTGARTACSEAPQRVAQYGSMVEPCQGVSGEDLGAPKPGDNSFGSLLGTMNNPHLNLAEMFDYPGPMAVLVEALKKKGVRFHEGDFIEGEITFTHDNVMVLRGRALEVVSRAFHSSKCCVTGRESALNLCANAIPANAGWVGILESLKQLWVGVCKKLVVRSVVHKLCPNAKLSHPDQATELLRKVVFYADRKSEQNRRVAARGWLQRLVRAASRIDL